MTHPLQFCNSYKQIYVLISRHRDISALLYSWSDVPSKSFNYVLAHEPWLIVNWSRELALRGRYWRYNIITYKHFHMILTFYIFLP